MQKYFPLTALRMANFFLLHLLSLSPSSQLILCCSSPDMQIFPRRCIRRCHSLSRLVTDRRTKASVMNDITHGAVRTDDASQRMTNRRSRNNTKRWHGRVKQPDGRAFARRHVERRAAHRRANPARAGSSFVQMVRQHCIVSQLQHLIPQNRFKNSFANVYVRRRATRAAIAE